MINDLERLRNSYQKLKAKKLIPFKEIKNLNDAKNDIIFSILTIEFSFDNISKVISELVSQIEKEIYVPAIAEIHYLENGQSEYIYSLILILKSEKQNLYLFFPLNYEQGLKKFEIPVVLVFDIEIRGKKIAFYQEHTSNDDLDFKALKYCEFSYVNDFIDYITNYQLSCKKNLSMKELMKLKDDFLKSYFKHNPKGGLENDFSDSGPNRSR